MATQLLYDRRILAYSKIGRAGLVLAIGVLVAASAAHGQSQAQGLNTEEKDTETIRETVVNSVTHEPIGRALVFSLDNRFAMLCDAGGHFEFKTPLARNEGTNRNSSGVVFFTVPAAGTVGSAVPVPWPRESQDSSPTRERNK